MSLLLSSLRRLFPFFFRRPRRRYTIWDDKLEECVEWIDQRQHRKVYVACRLLSTVEYIQARFPDAHVATISRMATGWSSSDPDAYLCCTATLGGPVASQMKARLRCVTVSQVLIFERK